MINNFLNGRIKVFVVIAWIIVSVAGAVAAPKLVDSLSYSFALPGMPAYEANKEIESKYGNGGSIPPLVLLLSSDNNSDSLQGAVESATTSLTELGARVASPSTVPDKQNMLDAETNTAYLLVYFPEADGPDPYSESTPKLESVIDSVLGKNASVRASIITSNAVSETSIEDTDRPIIVEILIGAVGALAVLLVVFRSATALLPIIMAAVAITTTFLATYLLNKVTDVSFIVQYLIGLIGLGVAIDYALLIVMRWREQRKINPRNAVAETLRTAGSAVVLSGVTVAVSLTSLLFVPVPFLRSVGIAGLLIPLFSVLVAVTLLPLILRKFGSRIDRIGFASADSTYSKFWARIGSFVARRRVATALVSFLVLTIMASPLLGLRLGTPEISGEGRGAQVAQTWSQISASDFGKGVLRPTEIIVPQDSGNVARELDSIPGVQSVLHPRTPQWTTGDSSVLNVILRDDPASEAGQLTLTAVQETASDYPGVKIGGAVAEERDFIKSIYGGILPVFILVCVATLIILGFALRSVWLPIKALLLNVVSVAAAYGITVWIWQYGNGTDLIFGLPATGTLPTWIPVAVFSFLFGLSMDYEVFILSRMKEEYERSGDTKTAISDGLAYTGRLVTSGALILALPRT